MSLKMNLWRVRTSQVIYWWRNTILPLIIQRSIQCNIIGAALNHLRISLWTRPLCCVYLYVHCASIHVCALYKYACMCIVQAYMYVHFASIHVCALCKYACICIVQVCMYVHCASISCPINEVLYDSFWGCSGA